MTTPLPLACSSISQRCQNDCSSDTTANLHIEGWVHLPVHFPVSSSSSNTMSLLDYLDKGLVNRDPEFTS
ncbi:hypothetical protein Pmani_007016 [Petrolisthes manimaculis]|uniref:Uncharacterized protein n=1 Tax=Petrolisthes manimaculis TaxID=1843537 RepID=A0AAE1UF84_9EUCA|nr:hypothetical protein Pmani_007016 [Petrolisthes manimaculis]